MRPKSAVLAAFPLSLVVAGCGSGGAKTVALPSITIENPSVPAASATGSASPTGATSPTESATSPTVTPTLITETIAPDSSPPTTRPSTSASLTLATYTNPRFGFSAKYPADFTKAMPPEDGDGQLFNSPDQAAGFTVDGVNNNNHQSAAQIYAAATAPTGGTTVTYKNLSGDVVTVSGTRGARVFYEREVVGTGSINSLSWTYPVADKAEFDPMVTLTVNNFTAGNVAETF